METTKQELNQPDKQYRTAGFWIRFFAYIFDVIAISAISGILLGIVNQYSTIPTIVASWISISLATIGIIGFVYFSVMTRLWSQTIGKMIMGIQVIRRNGEHLDWLTVIVREVPGRTISQLFGVHVGYLWVAAHPEKQGWHDLFSDTFVVHVNDIEGRRWVNVRKNWG